MQVKPWKLLAATIILSILAVPLAGCVSNSGASPASPEQQVATVKRGDLTTYITASSYLSFARTQELGFRINGYVAEVNVKEGDTVTQGQVLARLDTSTLQKALDTAELAIKTADVGLQEARDAEATVKAAEIDLETATTALRKLTYPYNYATFALDIPAALAAINDARLQMEQARAWIEMGPGSEKYGEGWRQFRLAQDSLLAAQQRLLRGQGTESYLEGRTGQTVSDYWALRAVQLAADKAQSTLDKAIATYKSGLDKAGVALQKAIKDRDNAKDDLSRAIIIAPFNAVITTVYISEGDEWKLGQAALSVAEPNRFTADVPVNEADIPWVKEGQKASLKIDIAGANVSGTITRIAPTVSLQQGVARYTVKIEIDPGAEPSRPAAGRPGQPAVASPAVSNPSGARPAVVLRPGLSVTANIIKEERKGVLLVPSQAISRQEGAALVQVRNGGAAEPRVVKTGLSDPQNTEVLEGLAEGDKVALPSGPRR